MDSNASKGGLGIDTFDCPYNTAASVMKKTIWSFGLCLVRSGAVMVLECSRCRVCLMLDGDLVSGLKCRVFLDAMHV